MSRQAKVDFAKAKEKKTILKGLVKMYDKNALDGKIEPFLTIDCNGSKVIIEQSEVVFFPYSKSLKSLVGEEIIFTVKEVFPNNIVYGSMKEAFEVKNRPIIDLLEKGEILEGKVVYETNYGAYIDIKGVQGFLKNIDFSDDGTEVTKIYPKGSIIKVKFKRYSQNGNILLLPEEKRHGSSAVEKSDIRKGQEYIGKIVGIIPDRMFVNIIPDVDCMCRVPAQFGETYRMKEYVLVRITFVGEKNGKLMVRGEVMSKVNRYNDKH